MSWVFGIIGSLSQLFELHDQVQNILAKDIGQKAARSESVPSSSLT